MRTKAAAALASSCKRDSLAKATTAAAARHRAPQPAPATSGTTTTSTKNLYHHQRFTVPHVSRVISLVGFLLLSLPGWETWERDRGRDGGRKNIICIGSALCLGLAFWGVTLRSTFSKTPPTTTTTVPPTPQSHVHIMRSSGTRSHKTTSPPPPPLLLLFLLDFSSSRLFGSDIWRSILDGRAVERGAKSSPIAVFLIFVQPRGSWPFFPFFCFQLRRVLDSYCWHDGLVPVWGEKETYASGQAGWKADR